VVVVMHRNEVSKSTNTARLAVRMLPNSEVRVRGALPPDTRPLATGRAAVLFPEPGAPSVSELASEQAFTLVVPDGSWSQARKLVRRDPSLAALPIVSLSAPEPTQYSLRRNGREGGLCTLEAIALALGALEGPGVEEALLGAFDLFVRTHHLARWGPRGGPPPERAR
jgi:DTW domain-containing protein YfiP